MELIERDGFLSTLQARFSTVVAGEGHCILVSGEAGIGKTSLVKAFCQARKGHCTLYQGTCDALFTPRPLAPLYDIAWQIRSDFWQDSGNVTDRAGLFARFFTEFRHREGTIVLVFEDVHWADEATLDFIKFLARRITQLSCLFILTYRDDEIHTQHPLRSVLGQLPPDTFTRLSLTPLSRQTVERMSEERGYSGQDVYGISGGNPFYVNEILAGYSTGIPDNVKDSILSVYNRQKADTKQVWEILSVVPAGFEINYLEKMEPSYASAIKNSLDSKILLLEEGLIFFKHELYRRTIEASLSPFLRVELNKRILDLFRESFERKQETERIIHHAKEAHAYGLVVRYAPVAARQAASVGAHIEASRLYLSAIEYYNGADPEQLIRFYEAYAYECYLTNHLEEAIRYQAKALEGWQGTGNTERTGNCLRFLSRFWWYEGNREQAEAYGLRAVEIMRDQPASDAKAMALSNMAQLKMLSDYPAECIFWGQQAIGMAKELGNEEILCHALNNVGTSTMGIPAARDKGMEMLRQSLEMALRHSYHEHAARAFTNLASNSVRTKTYFPGRQILEEGIRYCEERDLDSWTHYMLSYKARLCMDTGDWDEACRIAEGLLKRKAQAPIITIGALAVLAKIKMRRGEPDVLPLLREGREKAFGALELQRIIPVLTAVLEYEWITGQPFAAQEDLDTAIAMMREMGDLYETSELAFWLLKVRKQAVPVRELYAGYQTDTPEKAMGAAALWERLGCPYEQALALFQCDEPGKQKALELVRQLGAGTVYEKMKQEMRASGIKGIPRGLRRNTLSNPALLTQRELDVLGLIREGLQNKEIAARLFISAKTVDHHISSLLFKLDAKSRAKAVQEALKLGILQLR